MKLVDYGKNSRRNNYKPQKNKYYYWKELKSLGYNYNLKTVSSKTLKDKLKEIENQSESVKQ